MDFAERRRSRKSQSFKLINEEDSELRCLDGPGGIGVNGGVKDIAMAEAWFGDDGMEIKKQITGMMRMLNDKAARVYQRAGEEADTLKCEPQDLQVCCVSPDGSQQEEPQHSNWSLETTARSLAVGQYGTRSKTVKMKDPEGSVKVAAPLAEPPEPSCCTCSCKNTLQAILLELRAVRKLLQAQNGAQEKHLKAPSAFSPSRPPIPRRRPCLRRPLHKMAPLAPSRSSSPADCMTSESRRGTERSSSETFALEHLDQPSQSLPAQPEQLPPSASNSVGQFSLHREQPPAEPEVQLAEDYDVYIPKSQLDSILVNYTRSGSLLFRKLVCAFFDDATLATSLPNGKRKRGLNDNRKGLDQNIVGAIKVFTEKYCTANRIQKLPGPRDWVQILQDQIKLARRRLKREAADGGAVFGRMSTPTPGQDFKTSATPNNDA